MKLQFRSINQYTFLNSLEASGSCIYRAVDLTYDRLVLIKAVKIFANSGNRQRENLIRALEEIKALTRLEQENLNIPHVYAHYIDQNKGILYIVMQYVPGKSLLEHFNDPEEDFLAYCITLCEILEVMEDHHIYHRDLKPENILITPDNKPYLVDFGLSLSLPDPNAGTLLYRAPETAETVQLERRNRADMFALGVILYQFYTGIIPKRTVEYGKNCYEMTQEWDYFKEPRNFSPEMPDHANAIIVRLMKYNPKERYTSYHELKHELTFLRQECLNSQKKRPGL